jgi:hypothetical protein
MSDSLAAKADTAHPPHKFLSDYVDLGMYREWKKLEFQKEY